MTRLLIGIIIVGKIDEPLVIRKLDPDISYTFEIEYRNNLTKNERTYVKYIEKRLLVSNKNTSNVSAFNHNRTDSRPFKGKFL